MKFIISRQELAELVNRVQTIVAPKTPIPILSNLLLEARDNQIILTATDLTVGIRCQGLAKVMKNGSTTLPARRFAQLLRELTSQQIEISTNDREVTQIVADSSTFKIVGMPKTEFPILPELSGAQVVRIKQKELRNMLFQTAFAVSKEDNRYVLTGVYFQVQGKKALFVGTDGKRLARATLQLEEAIDVPAESIVPLKAIDEIMKNLNDDDATALVYVFGDKIAVDAGDILIMTKLLSGEYPDVDKVIPKETPHLVALHRDELTQLLRQISLFTNDTSHSVRFTFLPGELQLTANTTDIGEGKVSMPVNYQGARFDIAFNPHFFLDLLRHSKNETVTMGFSDPFNPGVIVDSSIAKLEGTDFPTPLFVLMPMRLGDE